MKLHPRHERRLLAGIELSEAVIAIYNKHDLTMGEMMHSLADRTRDESHVMTEIEDKVRRQRTRKSA